MNDEEDFSLSMRLLPQYFLTPAAKHRISIRRKTGESQLFAFINKMSLY